tara:strand:+ start:1465 stop:1860 length:396 start_codon:yes stop_codon:yes gene_type:complete
MNNKSRYLKTFNDHFEEFINDVLRVFPNDNDLITCKHALNKMRKMNPKMIMMCFYESVSKPYRNEIENGDVSFFIDKDYNKDMYFDGDLDKIVLEKIDLIREPVRNMCDEDKNSVLKYLSNLTKLCDLYNN